MRNDTMKRMFLFALALVALVCLAGPATAATPSIKVTGIWPWPDILYAGSTVTVELDRGGVTTVFALSWEGTLTLKDGSTLNILKAPDDGGLETDPDLSEIVKTGGELPEKFTVHLPASGKLSLTCSFSDENTTHHNLQKDFDVIAPAAGGVRFGPADVSPDHWASADIKVKAGAKKKEDRQMDLAATLWPFMTEEQITKAEWKSSDETVATVEAKKTTTDRTGKLATLKAVAAGKVEITVTVTTDRRGMNGSYGEYSETRTVTVTGTPKPHIDVRATEQGDLWLDWSDEDTVVGAFRLYRLAAVDGARVGEPFAVEQGARPAVFPIADIRSALEQLGATIDQQKILAECVDSQGASLGTSVVDLSKLRELPAPPALSTTIGLGDGVTAEFEGAEGMTSSSGTRWAKIAYSAIVRFLDANGEEIVGELISVSSGHVDGQKVLNAMKSVSDALRILAKTPGSTEARALLMGAVEWLDGVEFTSSEAQALIEDAAKTLRAIIAVLDQSRPASAMAAGPRAASTTDDLCGTQQQLREALEEETLKLKLSHDKVKIFSMLKTGKLSYTVTGASGAEAQLALLKTDGTVLEVGAAVGTGATTFGSAEFVDAQGDEVRAVPIGKEGTDGGATVVVAAPSQLFTAVPGEVVDATVVGLTLTGRSAGESVSEETSIGGAYGNGESRVDISEEELLKLWKKFRSRSWNQQAGLRAQSVATAAEDEDLVLTVSVKAKRNDNGAEGVTLVSVPVTVASDGGDGGSSGAGCDAGLGALAVMAGAGMILKRKA